jgi:hypothetical protein
MAAPDQLTFFASLDFPGRTTLHLREIAERLGCTVKHLLEQVDSGKLIGLDLKSKGVSRRAMRIPVECYRQYILSLCTGPSEARVQFFHSLPAAVRADVIRGLWSSLNNQERRELIRDLSLSN